MVSGVSNLADKGRVTLQNFAQYATSWSSTNEL